MGIGILVAIIIAAGLLGGVANYYMNKTDRGWYSHDFVKSSLLGLTAAATVPLFLKTVSSNLMQDCLNGDVISHFVFFGFCAVAAIFSSKFLQSLADKLLQEVQEVRQRQEELAETQDVLVRENSDPDDFASSGATTAEEEEEAFESFSTRGSKKATSVPPALTEEQKILRVFESGKYAFRSLRGVCRDSGLEEKLVATKLDELEARGLVKKIKRRSDGETVWTLSR